MALLDYIKVKTKTGEEAVVTTFLRPFYASQGAVISTPTQEEVEAAFPEEARKSSGLLNAAGDVINQLRAENERLRAENERLAAQLDKKRTTSKQSKK